VSPFWRVAVLVCRRFDHRPFQRIAKKKSQTPGWGARAHVPTSWRRHCGQSPADTKDSAYA